VFTRLRFARPAAKLEDVREFFRQYYAPNNATIAIAGDIDKAATKKLIEKYFGSLKRGPAVPPVNVKTAPITSERRLVVEDRVELPRIYMAWITPPYFKEGDGDADIAASILGQGHVSRLYKKLEYEKQIAQNVTAYQQSTMLGSIFAIEATARPGRTLQELEAAINEEIEALRTNGPTAAEVDRARNVLETQIFNGLQLVGGFGGVADQLNLYNHYAGTPDYLAQDIGRHPIGSLHRDQGACQHVGIGPPELRCCGDYAGAQGLCDDEDVADSSARVRPHGIRRDEARDRVPELHLEILNGVAAKQRHAAFLKHRQTAGEDRLDGLRREILGGKRRDRECRDRPSAHRVDVTDGIRGGDPAVCKRIVDDGREEVDGLHQRHVAHDEHTCIVRVPVVDQDTGIGGHGQIAQHLSELTSGELARSTGAGGVVGQTAHGLLHCSVSVS